MKIAILISSILISSVLLFTAACSKTSTPPRMLKATERKYTVTITSNWNATAHGTLPSNPHLSPFVAVAHDDDFNLFVTGSPATEAIEQVAETGATSLINGVIRAAGDDINDTKVLSVFNNAISGQSIKFDVILSESHPYLSFISMIAPSPDWFIGVNKLELYASGTWDTSETVELFAYDAGTEEGTEFKLDNAETSPAGNIARITGTGFTVHFATATIELQTSN